MNKLLLAGAAAAALVIDAARAADDAAPATVPVQMEQITVTAQRREQSINDVPVTISAFYGRDLEALGVTDLRDVGLLVPALSVNDSGQGTPIYTLRGVGFNDTTYTATGTVGLYVDEVNLPYSVMTKGLSVDLERVEVLKGPQGTLYGRNTTGGSINQIANKPGDHFQAGASVGYARFQTLEGTGFVSGPIADGLRGRAAIRVIDSGEGWQYSNTRPDDRLGRFHKGAGRGALDWDATDDLTLRAVVEGWLDRSEPQAPQAIGLNPQNGVFGSAALSPRVQEYPLVPQEGASNQVADWNPERPWRRHDNFLSESLRSDWAIDEDLHWITLLSHLRVEANGSDDIQSGFDFYNLESTTTAYIDTLAGETRFAGVLGEDFHWLLGLNASHDRAEEDHYVLIDTESAFFPIFPTQLYDVFQGLQDQGLDFGEIVSGLPGPPQYTGILEQVENGGNVLTNRFHSQGGSRTLQYAGFVNVDWEFVRTLTLTLGARYTRNDQDYHGCSREAPESTGLGASNLSTFLSFLNALQYTQRTGQPGNPSVAMKGDCFSVGDDGNHDEFLGELDEHNVSGRAGLDWHPTKDALFYVSFNRGYKAGGFPVLNACCKYQFTPTKQEQLNASEAGAKLTLFNRHLQANFAAFYYDYRDKQLLTKVADPVFGPLPILRNAPRSHVYGFETNLQSRPFNGLFVAVAAAWTHTEIDEFVSTNDAGDQQDFADRPFNFAPRYEVNAIADYTFPLGSWDFGAGADVQRSGATNGTLAQTPAYDMPAYTLVGARAHLRSPNRRWTASVFGRNLTNAFYSTASFNIGDSIARMTGFPRTYGVTLAYDLE